MKAVLTLFIFGFASALASAQDSGIQIRHQQSVTLSPGQGNPIYLIRADHKTLRLQDSELFAGGLSSTAYVNQINPALIQSINVTKGSAATDFFGPAGQNGVITIQLSDGALAKLPPDFASRFRKIRRHRLPH